MAQRVWPMPSVPGTGRPVPNGGAEVLDEADGLGDADAARARARVAVEDGDAAGIVAAVLDAVERVEEDGQRVSGPDVPRDSAHRQLLGGVLRAVHEAGAGSMAEVDR